MNVLHLVIFAAMMGAALSAVVAVAWQVQLTTGNTGWIDVFWTFGLGAVAIMDGSRQGEEGHGQGERQGHSQSEYLGVVSARRAEAALYAPPVPNRVACRKSFLSQLLGSRRLANVAGCRADCMARLAIRTTL